MSPDSASSSPATLITAVLLSPAGFDLIRETVQHLNQQTVRERIELLVLAARHLSLELPPEEVGNFAAARVVHMPPAVTVGQANALAVREAGAPLVVFCEDHSFPQPGWAEALMAAHASPPGEQYAAVGPCVENANPGTVTSWANFLVEYGPWTAHEQSHIVSHLPGHNSCYKREVLLPYGDALGRMLEAESVLQWDLQRQGYTLYLEARARTWHLNFSIWPATAMLRFHNGQNFAEARSAAWPAWRRLMFALAAPLIPLVRFRRILPIWKRCRKAEPRPKVSSCALFPLLLLALTLDAAGEMCGYAFGKGRSRSYLWDIEFDRRRFARD